MRKRRSKPSRSWWGGSVETKARAPSLLTEKDRDLLLEEALDQLEANPHRASKIALLLRGDPELDAFLAYARTVQAGR